MTVSLFMLFTICFYKETFPTCARNVGSSVAVFVHVSHIIGFVHESLVADIALESVLSLVSLHVILVSPGCSKSFATEAAVVPRDGGACRLLIFCNCCTTQIIHTLREKQPLTYSNNKFKEYNLKSLLSLYRH